MCHASPAPLSPASTTDDAPFEGPLEIVGALQIRQAEDRVTLGPTWKSFLSTVVAFVGRYVPEAEAQALLMASPTLGVVWAQAHPFLGGMGRLTVYIHRGSDGAVSAVDVGLDQCAPALPREDSGADETHHPHNVHSWPALLDQTTARLRQGEDRPEQVRALHEAFAAAYRWHFDRPQTQLPAWLRTRIEAGLERLQIALRPHLHRA